MKYASALPFTEDERDSCIASRRKTVWRGVNRRKARRTDQPYNVPGNDAQKRQDARIMGEREE